MHTVPGSRRELGLVGSLAFGGFVAGALVVGVPIVLAASKALEVAAVVRRRWAS